MVQDAFTFEEYSVLIDYSKTGETLYQTIDDTEYFFYFSGVFIIVLLHFFFCVDRIHFFIQLLFVVRPQPQRNYTLVIGEEVIEHWKNLSCYRLQIEKNKNSIRRIRIFFSLSQKCLFQQVYFC